MFDPRLMCWVQERQQHINVQGLAELMRLSLLDNKALEANERGVLAALVVLVVAHRGSQAEAPCPITT